MTIYPIEAGNFKLDGGAMFGVVPKTIWQKTNPADENNRIDIGARCLLIENKNRLILIDTGMGNKQSEKFYSYYHRWGNFSLEKSIQKLGFSMDEVTDVFFTHLHFDHVGGATYRKEDIIETTFSNANYWSNKEHWDWAVNPNYREKASFLKENLQPIVESGQLKMVTPNENYNQCKELPFGICYVNGHTEKQMLPILQYKDKTIVFMGDLLPTIGHIPLPYVMGYDTRPLITIEEKKAFLEKAAINNWYLFLQHDAHHEIITVQQSITGIRLKESYSFNELFN